MTTKESIYKISSYARLVFVVSAVICGTYGMVNYIRDLPNEKQPQIKPCKCLTYYEWQLLSTKRDIILDKRKRSETDNITLDSINVELGLPSRR